MSLLVGGKILKATHLSEIRQELSNNTARDMLKMDNCFNGGLAQVKDGWHALSDIREMPLE